MLLTDASFVWYEERMKQEVRKRGRLVQVWMSDDERDWLKTLADEKGLTMADVVRLKVREEWEQREKRVA